MKTLRATLTVFVLAATLSRSRDAAAQRFDYGSQLGVIEVTEQICLIIPNDKLNANDVVHVILPKETQLHIEARITAKSPKSCSRSPYTRPTDSFYILQARDQKIEVGSLGLGLVNYKSTFKLQGGLWGFNPHDDDSWEFLRTCTSSEGLHFSVWRGRPLKGKRIWHWYYDLGYDVDPDCTEGDFKDLLPE